MPDGVGDFERAVYGGFSFWSSSSLKLDVFYTPTITVLYDLIDNGIIFEGLKLLMSHQFLVCDLI